MLFFDAFIYLSVIIFYSIIIIGYGAKFKKIFFKTDKNCIGEFGIYGFIALYFLSISIHFFFPINPFIRTLIFGSGIYFFFKEIKYKQIKFLADKKIILTLLIFLLICLTNKFHDDLYLYQLPYINYVQKFKIIFGLVTINDYMAYGHGFYDILAIFKLPIISNSLIFVLPVIFLVFFIFHIYEQRKNYNYYTKFFISLILSILFLRYYQSKDYGTDLAVLLLIFLIQINLLNYFLHQNINFLYKSVLYLTVGIFFKIYMIFSIFYLIPFVIGKKIKQLNIIKYKKIIFFLFILTFFSLIKNIIHSGCFIYPLHQSCFESKNLSWSYGKELSKKRSVFLEAASKGWLTYYRFTPESELLAPDEYLTKFKYNYFKNLIRDQDSSHLILLILVFLILVNLKTSNTQKNIIKISNKNFQFSNLQKKYLIFFSTAALLFWLFLSPHLRYGGYGFIAFFLFSIAITLGFLKKIDFKKIKVFIFITILFLVIKNINRIYEEVTVSKFNIIPVFKNISYTNKKISSVNINISKDSKFCGNIEMLCVVESNFSSIKNISKNYNYLIIKKNKNEIINNMKLEILKIEKD